MSSISSWNRTGPKSASTRARGTPRGPPPPCAAEELCAAVERLREATERLQRRLATVADRTGTRPASARGTAPLVVSFSPGRSPRRRTHATRQRTTPQDSRAAEDGRGGRSSLGATEEDPRRETSAAEARGDSPLIVELHSASGIRSPAAVDPPGETAQRVVLHSRAVAIEEEVSKYVDDLLALQRDVVEAQERGLMDKQSDTARVLEIGLRDEIHASRARASKVAALRDGLQESKKKMY